MSALKSLAMWTVSRGVSLPHGHLERVSELWHLRQLLDLLQPDCVLDVGANIGQFADELRGIGYTGHIVSFEPSSLVYRSLQHNRGGDERWSGYHCALGASDGELTLTIPRLTVLSSLLPSKVEDPAAKQEIVKVRRLDDLMPEIRQKTGARRIFLKMDTQGFDLEVFTGAGASAGDLVGLQSELSVQPLYEGMPHYLEALAAYEAAGFELHNLAIVNRTEDGGLLELNCFMKRRQA